MGDDVAYVDLAAACSLLKKTFLHHHALVTNEARNRLHKQVHDNSCGEGLGTRLSNAPPTSTSRPPNIIHVIGVPRPSPFFALFRFCVLY